MRLEPDPEALKPSKDDIEALANAVREAARPRRTPESIREAQAQREVQQAAAAAATVEVGRKGHLRVLRSVE